MSTTELVSVRLDARAAAALRNSAQRDETNRTAVIHRALRIYDQFGDWQAQGYELIRRDPATGDTERITLIIT